MQPRYFTEITNYKTNYTRQSTTYKSSVKGLVSDRKNKFVKQTSKRKKLLADQITGCTFTDLVLMI